MKIVHLKEPRLMFATGEHVCPRRGIAVYGVYDKTESSRRTKINVGAIGTPTCLEGFADWLDRCGKRIEGPAKTRQPNLFPDFPGMNVDGAFFAEFNFEQNLGRPLRNTDLKQLKKIKVRKERVEQAVELYYEQAKFLAQNRHVDVIVCVIPDALYKLVATEEEAAPVDESLEEEKPAKEELNFRRSLKARAMHLGKPLQLFREASLAESGRGQQDEATKAWNFCTALYYKSGPTIPWKLTQDSASPTTCSIGIAFYRSRDYQSLNTSLAQIFDELGNGLILRGTPVDLAKDDRRPHLSTAQAHDLVIAALNEYRIAMRNFPARVVVHKSSNFSADELAGCTAAIREMGIDTVDFVTVIDSKMRLFRDGDYPPFRGTFLQLDDDRHLLYTRGSVWYYQTYPGMYIPQPIELRIVQSERSPTEIAREILGLTKLNWNNTQFDGKYPVTLGCARKVGEIMKYLEETDKPQIRYAYYM